MNVTVDTEGNRATLRPKGKAPVIQRPGDHFLAAQQFNKLALTLVERMQPVEKGRASILCVTGVDMTVGKTLASVNLAVALGRKGESSVLLVEADLWRPGIGQYLQVDSSLPGLYQILEGKAEITDAILELDETGCHVLPAGGQVLTEDPVFTKRMNEILAWAGSRYDFIIIDSPPFGTAAGQYAAKVADGAAIVVGAGKTKKRNLEHALQDLGPDQVVGFILNGVRQEDMSEAVYGYGYGYGYGARPKKSAKVAGQKFRLSRGWIIFFVVLALAAVGGGFLSSFRPALLRRIIEPVIGTAESPDPGGPDADGAAQGKPAPSTETGKGEEAGAGDAGSAPEDATSLEPLRESTAGDAARVRTRLNLRFGPGTEYTLLVTLPAGETVQISDEASGWLKVSRGELEGWAWGGGLEVLRGSEMEVES